MAFNIADFKSNFESNGVLQTNKFEVIISLPSAMQGFNVNDQKSGQTTSTPMLSTVDDLRYRCTSATIPGLTMRTADINRFGIGVTEKMPYSANYTDVSFTFICDRYGDAYNFWYLWFNYIFGANGEETNSNVYGSAITTQRSFYTAEYKDNYAATINVNVYDTAGNKGIVVNLYKAFPVSINDTALSWSDNNNLVKLTTQVTFREWDLGNLQNSPTGVTLS